MSTATATGGLDRLVGERERVLSAFLEREGERIARVCHELARAFARGGALLPYGTAGAASDAAHVAVEFMHPVIVGKRALPAVVPGAAGDVALARADDVALAIAHGAPDAEVAAFLAEAGRRGLLRIALVGPGGEGAQADHVLVVDGAEPSIVQEVQETAYHVLWELVHVFFEHPGLLEDACVTCGDVAVEAEVVALTERGAVVQRSGARETVARELVGDVAVGDRLLCHAGVALERLGEAPTPAADEATSFLYPFLESSERDLDAVLADVRDSTVRKGADVCALRRAIDLGAVEAGARAVRSRLEAGARLLAFGNGGSATDAQDAAFDARARGWPAAALNDDAATITAVANDVGFENVFARQLIALGRHGDVALAISTSGSSANVVAGLREARRRGLLTVALVGHGGGRVAGLGDVDHVVVVHSDYVPRVQEAQATIYHLLLEAIGNRG